MDHIFANRPQRIHSIGVWEFGLADHLPVFAVRFYKRASYAHGDSSTIKYHNVKGFDESRFLASLKENPWDTAFIFNSINDVLGAWEDLSNQVLVIHCPWREKRVSRKRQVPWITKDMLWQIHKRDSLLKKAEISSEPRDWELYRSARDSATNSIRSAKSKFYQNCFEESTGNTKQTWKTIKSLTGVDGNISGCARSAEDFNLHFATNSDRIRAKLPNIPFDVPKLINFVRSRKDPDIVFSIPSVTVLDL